jgi:hypothetical protein
MGLPGQLGPGGGKQVLRLPIQERIIRAKVISVIGRICLLTQRLTCIAVDQ